jgi:methionyl-tRNA formyltransferase
MKIGLFLMTQKGFLVLENLLKSNHKNVISFVCVGIDKEVQNDFSEEIVSLCKLNSIVYYFRNELLENEIAADYNIAISWRWMLDVSNLIVLHDSILPKYRGFAPLVNMLINGENEIGVTALIASDEYDKGDILLQIKKNISYPLKIVDAIELISELYCIISINIIESMLGDQIILTKQNDSAATYSLWLDNDDYFIDWNWDADKIKRKIDACGFPYLGAKTNMENQVIIIKEVDIVQDVEIENRTVGKTIFFTEGCPIIVCGKGLLKITDAYYQNSNESIFPLKKFRIKLS